MANIIGYLEVDFDWSKPGRWSDYEMRTAEMLAAYRATLTGSAIVGKIFKMLVNGGRAEYIVVSEYPLHIVHYNPRDGYAAPEEVISALTIQDVRVMVARESVIERTCPSVKVPEVVFPDLSSFTAEELEELGYSVEIGDDKWK